jgi:hypothetical protein
MFMVAFKGRQHGGVIIDNIVLKFTFARYPGKHHAVSKENLGGVQYIACVSLRCHDDPP